MSRQQPGGTGTDHGRAPGQRRPPSQDVLGLPDLGLGKKPLDVTDPDGTVELQALAVKFTWMAADISENARKGESLADGLERLTIAACPGELDVEVSVHAQRTQCLAVRGSFTAAPVENALCDSLHPGARSPRRADCPPPLGRRRTLQTVTGS
jgi:hypothetical protein